jgi:hypothetical protein
MKWWNYSTYEDEMTLWWPHALLIGKPPCTMDYTCEDWQKDVELRGDIGARAVRSNRNRIVFRYRIECFCPNPNRMTFRYDSIRSGQKHFFFRKALKFDSSIWKIHKQIHKRDCQIFLPSWWIITSKISPSPAGQSFFHDFSSSFVSNRIVFWSNRNRIERFLQLVDRKSNRNQFDLTALIGAIR